MVEMLEAVVFDMDGVIAETEGEGHRVAFNEVFKAEGIKAEWDYDTYGELLKISGGKERMRSYFREHEGLTVPEDEWDDYIAALHRKKTLIFQDLIKNGKIPPRPGVRDFVQSIINSRVYLALATTSNEKAAHTLITSLLGKQIHNKFDAILAGDVVHRKKPDPEIYNLAVERLEIDPAKSFVIEDTRNGLEAALSAGFHVCVTSSAYTKHEDFTGAAFVVDDLLSGNITVEKLDRYIQEKHS
ncbi:HAD-IA family hydrolase [bacterium]|nr:HAD-IA family hydrolase [bacterium]